MRRLFMIIATILASAFVAHGAEDARRNVMLKMAEAMAYARVCDLVDINPEKFRAAAQAFHLHLGSGEADNRTVTIMAKGSLLALSASDDSEETLCSNAIALYGPGGANAPDLLRTK